MNTFKLSALAVAITAVAACGGDGSSSGGGATPAATPSETGVFVDSAVAGINYSTSPSGMSGKTNALGEYNYEEGDTVTFSIGGTSLPPVAASGRVTPADMSDDADIVTNVLQLLQTLDEDGNPDNGISIGDQAHNLLDGVSLDVTGAAGDFDSQAETAIGETLVSEEQANEHFAQSQQADLRGSWVFVEPAGESSNGQGPNGEEINVITFLDGQRYIVAHKYGNEDQGAATVEWGFYSWDPVSGQLSTEVSLESDSDGGLGNGTDTLRLVGDELHLGSEEGAETPFMAVESSSNPYVGSWYFPEGEDFNVLTILDGSNYVVAHSNNAEAYTGEPVSASSEWGTYSIAGGQFQVTGNVSETDGPGGFYDDGSGASADVEATAYGDLLMAFGPQDRIAFVRVGRFPVDLEDLSGEESTVIVERVTEMGFPDDGMPFGFVFEMAGEDLDGNGENDYSMVQLGGDGSGTLTFALETEDEEESVINAPWEVLDSGTLSFTETIPGDLSTGSWNFAIIKGGDEGPLALVDFSHISGGTHNPLGFFISPLFPTGPAPGSAE